MASRRSVAVLALAVFSSVTQVGGIAAEIKPRLVDSPKNAPKLVEQAISAGLAGNVDEHAALLKRAAEADPDYAPAKWQRGLVNFEGAWRTPQEVASSVSSDKRWQEYDSLRGEAGDTPADHLRLAQWSMRQGLTAEERYHWANVLAANPGHAQARQRLGAQEYQGQLYTREQVAAEKARLEQAKRDAAKFKPQFSLWCKNATSELKATREKGLAKIRATNDVAAIPALRDAVSRALATSGGKEHRSELVLAMTAALAGIPEHPATLALTELSVFSSLPEVRLAAAKALSMRPPTDFVPLLMATLEAPIEAEVDVMAAPDGTVRFVETLTQQQQTHVAAQVRSVNFEVTGALGRGRANTGVALNRNLNATSRRVATTQQQLDEHNAASAERNARIIQVLKKVLDEEPSREDVAAWWESWQNYNELSYGDINRVVETRLDETYLTRLEPPCECFAPGTLVWRQSGPTPIEQIRVGDMVLSQHPSTGELAYRPVLETTVGPLSAVMKVKLPNEEFVSTLGHRFWVDGSGWAMAKELQLPASLHTLQGSAKIEELTPDGELECHNLVVDDFHTFVIGKSQLVVHDKTCPQPTLALSPGFVPKRGTARDIAKSFTSATP